MKLKATSSLLLMSSNLLSSISTAASFSVVSSRQHQPFGRPLSETSLSVSSGKILCDTLPTSPDDDREQNLYVKEPTPNTAITPSHAIVEEKQQVTVGNTATSTISTVVTPKSGRNALPEWARNLNDGLGMMLITHADKKHVHAISGSAWYIGGYILLITAWAKELLYNDWSTFAHFDGLLPVATIGAMVCALASAPLRHEKRFPRYSDMMRNGMVTGAFTALLAASFANMDPTSWIMADPIVHGVVQGTAVFSLATLAYMAVVDRMPWDISDLIEELKLEMPPVLILRLGRVIAFAWMVVLAIDASHVFGSGMLEHETSRAFLAQMAFSLSMAPSGDALAGSLMQRDRFSNTSGQHLVIKKTASGKYETSRAFEFVQLLLNDPGPFLITMGVAVFTQHMDLVQQFFYLSS